MTLGSETSELELLARAFRAISKEISYRGLAEALLKAALGCCGAVRGAVLLSEGGQLLAKADASFSREMSKVCVSEPAGEFRLPQDLGESVLGRQEIVIRSGRTDSQTDPAGRPSEHGMAVLCMPLVHQERTIGVLYLESEAERAAFMPRCVSVLSMLASQAAVAFESAQLFEALRETNMWMVKGQQIGRMGSYRWNTRTLLSRASRECYRIFDIDLSINPVPFEVFRSRIHSDDLPALELALGAAVSSRSPFSHEYRVVHQDGATLHVVAVGQFDLSPTGDVELEGIITDVTERRAAEQALTDARAEHARAARLASIGELAGSIVHEINQPLAAMMTSADACVRWLAQEPVQPAEACTSALRVIEQGRRMSNIVAGLRSLVRDAPAQFAGVKINESVEEVLLLSKRELERSGVTLKTAFNASLPEVEADRVQLQQVVLNLVRNAIDAMAGVEERPRVLTVSSRVAGACAAVTVTDTGVGVDPACRERLFDALYTTKEEGLGLGLSICRKIIGAHGGSLWIEENTKHGASFTFTVPLHRSATLARNH